jgi:hypothetical protein
MAVLPQTYITGVATQLAECGADLWNATAYLESAGDAIRLQNWLVAESQLDSAAYTFRLAAQHLSITTNNNAKYWLDLCLEWIQNNLPTGGAVTMDAILNVMLTASFANLQQFIGIEDAYRVALWNAPFNVDFYAALARGFQKWP